MVKYELLSNHDLVELSAKMNIQLIGVPSKDRLKTLPLTDGSFIINLDDFGNAGTHWVALYIEGKYAVYFDPFGQVAPLAVHKFCRTKQLITSDFIIQNLNTYCCGYYCLGFLHFMTKRNISNIRVRFNKFIKPFDLEDTTNNDNILQSYFLNNVKI